MKKISIWAKNHVWQSRMIIIVIYILLNVIGIFTGKWLKEINIDLPKLYFTATILSTILLWIAYPNKLHTKPSVTSSAVYVRRKLFDFGLGAVTFLMIIYAGNNWEHLFIKSESAQASKIIRIPGDSAITNHPLFKSFIADIQSKDISKLSQREKIKIIKQQIKTIKKDDNTSKSNKTLLIVLSVLAALVLLYALAALSCSIACTGSEALAIIIALAGTFLIVFFLVRVIKRISRREIKKEEAEAKPVPIP